MSWSSETDDGKSAGKSQLIENLEAIRQLPIFKDIPHEIVKLHAYAAGRRRYDAGTIIFQKGDISQMAYLVLSGSVALFIEEGDREMDLQVLNPMEFFGYMALLARFEWPISSRAVTDAELLTIDRESFRKILARFPEKCLLIVEKLVQMRMKRLKAHMEVLMKNQQHTGGEYIFPP